MYKVYKVSAGAMANGRLQEFDPVKNNFEWDGYTTEMIEAPDMAYGKAPLNAIAFGANLDQRLAPPEFEVVCSGDKAVQLRIGPDALHPNNTTIPIETVYDAQKIANERIDLLRNMNSMLERSPVTERIEIAMTHANRVVFRAACGEPGVTENTFTGDVLDTAMKNLGEKLSAYSAQQMYTNFITPYFDALATGEGTLPENAARALTISYTQLACAELTPDDAAIVREELQGVQSMVDALWQARSDKVWKAWQETDTATLVPAEYSATFKTSFLNDVSATLGDNNWEGDMALVYTAAYEAAYRAGEQASHRHAFDVTEKYVTVQQHCIHALDAIRDEAEKAAEAGQREREHGYQKYENPNDPEFKTTVDGQEQEDYDEEWNHNGP